MSAHSQPAHIAYSKDACGDDAARTYRALTDDPENNTSHRLAVILSQLINHLIQKDILTDDELSLMISKSRR